MKSLRTILALGAALVFGSISNVQAGVINNLTFVENPLSFTSTWNWAFTAGSWAAPAVTVTGTDWEVTLEGFANLTLRDTSRHLSNPHGAPEIAPNALSFFDYANAAAGIGPIVTVFDHPNIAGHFDEFTMTTTVGVGVVGITFNGEHKGPPVNPDADRRTEIPEPATLVLFGLGLASLGFATRRRRRV